MMKRTMSMMVGAMLAFAIGVGISVAPTAASAWWLTPIYDGQDGFPGDPEKNPCIMCSFGAGCDCDYKPKLTI